MRAVLYDDFRASPVVADVADPVCPPDGAVIAVLASGVCRSDWHAWMGHDDVTLPHVPGHEFAGEIVEVGAEVSDWRPGDVVTVPFVCACGQCAPCRAGDHQVCVNGYQPGFSGWGSHAELVAIRHADVNVVRLPESMDPVVAAGLGCRFSTAYRAVTARARLSAGETLAVYGCGGVGLSAVMIAKSLGARVIAVDLSQASLDAARRFGADETVFAGVSAPEHVRDLTGGGADATIDAFGSAEACRQAVQSLRPRGRHVQVGLLAPEDDLTAVPISTVITRELEILGSHGMSSTAFAPMLADIAAGRLDPGALIGRTIGLDEAPAALMAMSAPQGTGGTTVIDFR